jgi:dTDP-4-dehydrorhamnose 3,5-epimerase-like enzyme
VENCYILDFNSIGNKKIGYLVALEENKNIPFDVKRVYYTYGVPSSVERGFHAHKKLDQVLVCVNGSLIVKCFDGNKENTFVLDSPNKGLYIGNMIWREMRNYSEDTVLMVLASEYYSEEDYIRKYNEFLNLTDEIAIIK